MATTSTRTVVIPLGLAQTLAWASSYYLPALLAHRWRANWACPRPGCLPPSRWRWWCRPGPARWRGLIDRHGGRPVLMGTSGLFALGLLGMSQAQGLVSLLLAWAVVGWPWGPACTRRPSPPWCGCMARGRATPSPASR
jgi:hypothetical protein